MEGTWVSPGKYMRLGAGRCFTWGWNTNNGSRRWSGEEEREGVRMEVHCSSQQTAYAQAHTMEKGMQLPREYESWRSVEHEKSSSLLFLVLTDPRQE